MPTYTAEIIIKASTQKVFEALTKPELIKLWQYGRVVTTDWQVGGPIRFSSEMAGGVEPLEQWGTILDIRPNGFAPATLKPILVGLKRIAEMN